MFGNDYFGHFAKVEEPMEENNEVQEERQDVENTNFNEDYGLIFLIRFMTLSRMPK